MYLVVRCFQTKQGALPRTLFIFQGFYFFLAAVFFLAAGLACPLDGSSAGFT